MPPTQRGPSPSFQYEHRPLIPIDLGAWPVQGGQPGQYQQGPSSAQTSDPQDKVILPGRQFLLLGGADYGFTGLLVEATEKIYLTFKTARLESSNGTICVIPYADAYSKSYNWYQVVDPVNYRNGSSYGHNPPQFPWRFVDARTPVERRFFSAENARNVLSFLTGVMGIGGDSSRLAVKWEDEEELSRPDPSRSRWKAIVGGFDDN